MSPADTGRPAKPVTVSLRLSVFAASLHPRNDRCFCSRVKGDRILPCAPRLGGYRVQWVRARVAAAFVAAAWHHHPAPDPTRKEP